MAGFISDADFKEDQAPVQGAGAGFISDADFVSDEQKYGEGIPSALKAGGLGAARSASFGLSDQFLVRSGAIKPEDLEAYKKYQPTATALGEVGGIAGAILAPEAGVLGVLSAPVKGVAALGKTVTKAVPLAAEASPAISRILSQAAALGAGSAVEGAVYGLGQSVSEQALGDPDLNAEKVFSNVGTSAALGGALGSLFGGVKGAVKAAFPKFLSEVDQAAIDAGDFEAIARNSDMPESTMNAFVENLGKKKANAPEIEAAAKALGDAPVLPGMISDNKLVQKGQSALLEGPPTYASLKAQSLADEGFQKATAATKTALGEGDEITKATLGDALKNTVTESVESQNAPIREIYNEIKKSYQQIPVEAKDLVKASEDIQNIEGLKFTLGNTKKLASNAAEVIQNIKTVDDVKSAISNISGSLGTDASANDRRVLAVIKDLLRDVEEKSVLNFAERESGTLADPQKVRDLLDTRKAADKSYAVFKSKLDEMGTVLGRKKVHGPQDFLDFLEGLTPEKVADKLAGKNNSQFLEFFSKELPDAMKSISDYQKGVIRQKAQQGELFNVKRALKEIESLPKEYRSKVFSQAELDQLKNVKTYIDSFPPNFNPSNTANASAFRQFFEKPATAISSNIRDTAIDQFIKGASTNSDLPKHIINGLSSLEREAQKTNRAIKSGVNAIFSEEKYSPRYVLPVLNEQKKKDHDKTRDELTDLGANPEKMVEKMTAATEAMSVYAPRNAEGIQSTMLRAVQFLGSNLPGTNVPKKPLSSPYKPSRAELSKWYKYFAIVENPTDALKQVASGSLTKETMQALKAVYPRLLKDMQMQVSSKMIEQISKKKTIPFKTKLNLSLFLESDLVNSLDPVSMLANQNTLSTATQNKAMQTAQQMTGVNQKGLSKIDQSNRLLTPMQESAQRKEV